MERYQQPEGHLDIMDCALNFNFPAATDGTYTILADFLNYQYTLTSP